MPNFLTGLLEGASEGFQKTQFQKQEEKKIKMASDVNSRQSALELLSKILSESQPTTYTSVDASGKPQTYTVDKGQQKTPENEQLLNALFSSAGIRRQNQTSQQGREPFQTKQATQPVQQQMSENLPPGLQTITSRGKTKVIPPKSSPEKEQELKSQQKMSEDSLKVKNLLRTNIASFRAMSKASGMTPGRAAGVKNWIEGALGSNPNVQPYEGHQNMIAATLAKIATPSGRPGPELVNMFKKELAGIGSTEEELYAHTRDSLHNASSMRYAAMGKEYDANAQEETDKMLQEVFATPSYPEQGSEVQGKESQPSFTGKEQNEPMGGNYNKKYTKTGVDQITGKRVGMLPDGTIEEIQ